MRRTTPSTTLVLFSALIVALTVTSCSVFGPVGGAVSQGYENTISYFNAYYNAKKLYDEAEEEVLTYRLNQRGQRTVQGAPAQAVPGNSKAKFTQVIEKCSSILSFHETSALVDDALLLIGKSYYYQNEFLKAERKFEELLAQSPDGSLSQETQLWLLRCYAENGRREEGLQLGEALRSTAMEEGEDELAGQALLVLARLVEESDPALALRHLNEALPLLDDDIDQGTAQAKIGDILMRTERTEEAVAAYLKIPDMTSDTYLRFYGMVHGARALGALERYEEALTIADELLDDYTFSPYWSEVRYEVAEAEARLGRIDDAIDDFTYIDTTAARTEFGTRAAFRKGWILEHEKKDYAAAQTAYARAAGFTVPGVTAVAKQRENALAAHRSIHLRLAKIDSVLRALEVPAPEPEDSAQAAVRPPDPDSLRAEITKSEFELGELFYAELEVPDSALYYYDRVLEAPPDTVRTPRVLYILADLSRKENLGMSTDSLYRVIIRDYPASPYALAAKEALGIPLPTPKSDPAKALYAEAERSLQAQRTEEAMDQLGAIIDQYPESEYAGQSRYALGWIYEYVLAEPDSALSQYRMLVEDYGGSPFASRVRQRVVAAEKPKEAPRDSSLIEQVERVEPPAGDRRPQTEEEVPQAPGSRRQGAGQNRTAVPPKDAPPKKKED